MRMLLWSLLLWIAASACPAQPLPAFDVASIKPTQHGRKDGLSISYDPEIPSPGNFQVINNSLGELIRWAYRVKSYQVSGPNWMDDDAVSFDIQAKMPTATRKLEARQMLQSLLAQRFGLTLHRETRTATVYELVLAKGGPKLEPVKPDSKTGISYEGKFWSTLSSESTTTKDFADFLSGRLDRPVIDKTGIPSRFAVKLEYRIDESDSSRPDMFEAIQQKMGLSLKKAPGSVEVLVIDRLNKTPSEN